MSDNLYNSDNFASLIDRCTVATLTVLQPRNEKNGEWGSLLRGLRKLAFPIDARSCQIIQLQTAAFTTTFALVDEVSSILHRAPTYAPLGINGFTTCFSCEACIQKQFSMLDNGHWLDICCNCCVVFAGSNKEEKDYYIQKASTKEEQDCIQNVRKRNKNMLKN